MSTDRDGRVNFINRVAEDLTGWTGTDAVGRPLTEVFRIINEFSREPVENPAMRALAEGRIVGLANHTLLIDRKGRERPIDDSAAPIKSPNGETLGAVLIFRDIEERHKAEAQLRESEKRFRLMADTAPVLIWVADKERRRTWFNKMWLDFVGRSMEHEVGDGWVKHIHPDDRERVLAEYERAFDELRDYSVEYRLRRHDGQYRWVLAHGTPRYLGGAEFSGFIGSVFDISDRKAAEEANARIAAIVESSDDAIVSKGLDGIVRSWNPSAEKIFGFTEAEAVGKHISLIIPEDRLSEEAEVLARLQRGEKIDHFETIRQAKDGRLLNIMLTVSPVKDRHGNVIGASKVARDVTAQRASEVSLRESEQRLRLALEAGKMGSWEWNVNTDQVFWSPTLEAIHGLEPGTFPGTFEAFRNDIHPEDRDHVLGSIKRSLAEGDHHIEYRLVLPDGSIRWVEARGRLVREDTGTPLKMVGVCIDITERKTFEESLRMIAAELSEADRRKNEFLAMLAHELRNPLAPISNALEILKISGGSPERLPSAVRMMERQVNQLVRLVDDLLDVSRISRGKIELRLERVELGSVIEQAIEVTRHQCDSAGLELKVVQPEGPVYVHADRTRLNQLLGNLLSNACKFTPSGGQVELIVEPAEKAVAIRVRDTGIGIENHMLNRIFEMFVQADTSLERTVSGLGIGLTLVRSLAEMHGGSVTVNSDGPGRGSEFVVEIPMITPTEAQTPSESGQQPENAKSRKILVVDDNLDSAESLALILELSGHVVKKAHDGREAVARAAEFRPDVVLLDIGLPLLNGYEAAREIRKQEWGRDMALFALTGWGQKEDRARSKEAGFDEHMVKPINHVELMQKLDALDDRSPAG
jgi:two-component system, chemotaxis family, CheB/CheR fusion protein